VPRLPLDFKSGTANGVIDEVITSSKAKEYDENVFEDHFPTNNTNANYEYSNDNNDFDVIKSNLDADANTDSKFSGNSFYDETTRMTESNAPVKMNEIGRDGDNYNQRFDYDKALEDNGTIGDTHGRIKKGSKENAETVSQGGVTADYATTDNSAHGEIYPEDIADDPNSKSYLNKTSEELIGEIVNENVHYSSTSDSDRTVYAEKEYTYDGEDNFPKETERKTADTAVANTLGKENDRPDQVQTRYSYADNVASEDGIQGNRNTTGAGENINEGLKNVSSVAGNEIGNDARPSTPIEEVGTGDNVENNTLNPSYGDDTSAITTGLNRSPKTDATRGTEADGVDFTNYTKENEGFDKTADEITITNGSANNDIVAKTQEESSPAQETSNTNYDDDVARRFSKGASVPADDNTTITSESEVQYEDVSYDSSYSTQVNAKDADSYLAQPNKNVEFDLGAIDKENIKLDATKNTGTPDEPEYEGIDFNNYSSEVKNNGIPASNIEKDSIDNVIDEETRPTDQETINFDFTGITTTVRKPSAVREVADAKEGREPTIARAAFTTLATDATGTISFDPDDPIIRSNLVEEFGEETVAGWEEEGTYITQAQDKISNNPNYTKGVTPRVQESTNFSYYLEGDTSTISVFNDHTGVAYKNSIPSAYMNNENTEFDLVNFSVSDVVGFGANNYEMPQGTAAFGINTDGGEETTSRDISGTQDGARQMLDNLMRSSGYTEALNAVSSAANNVVDILNMDLEADFSLNNDYGNVLRRLVTTEAPAILMSFKNNLTIEGSDGGVLGNIVEGAVGTLDAVGDIALTAGNIFNHPGAALATMIRGESSIIDLFNGGGNDTINVLTQGSQGKHGSFGGAWNLGESEDYEINDSFATKSDRWREDVSGFFGLNTSLVGGDDAEDGIKYNKDLLREKAKETADEYSSDSKIQELAKQVGLTSDATYRSLISSYEDIKEPWKKNAEDQLRLAERINLDTDLGITLDNVRASVATIKPTGSKAATNGFGLNSSNLRSDIAPALKSNYEHERADGFFEFNGQEIPYPSNISVDGEDSYSYLYTDTTTGWEGPDTYGLNDAFLSDADKLGAVSHVSSSQNDFYVELMKSNTLEGGKVTYTDVDADPHFMNVTAAGSVRLIPASAEGKDKFLTTYTRDPNGNPSDPPLLRNWLNSTHTIVNADEGNLNTTDPDRFSSIFNIDKEYFYQGGSQEISAETLSEITNIENDDTLYNQLRYNKIVVANVGNTPDNDTGETSSEELDPHRMEVESVTAFGVQSQSDNLTGKDIFYRHIIEKNDAQTADDYKHFNFSQFKLSPDDDHNIFNALSVVANGDIQTSDINSNVRSKIANVSRDGSVNEFYDGLMLNRVVPTMDNNYSTGHIETDDSGTKILKDPHFGFKVKYENNAEVGISAAKQGKDLFTDLSAQRKFDSEETVYSWASIPGISTTAANYQAMLGDITTSSNLLANEQDLFDNFFDANAPKNSFVVVKSKYRAKLSGPGGNTNLADSAQLVFNDFRFLDENNNIIDSVHPLNADGTVNTQQTINVDFSNSNFNNSQIMANVPMLRETIHHTASYNDGAGNVALGPHAEGATADNSGNISAGDYGNVVTNLSDNRLMVDIGKAGSPGEDAIDVVADAGSFIDSEIGMIRSTGEQDYAGRFKRSNSAGAFVKKEILPQFFTDRESIKYKDSDNDGNPDPHTGIIEETTLHEATIAFNADGGDDNDARYVAHGTNSQLEYRGGDDSTTTLSVEKKSDFYEKIRDKWDIFATDGMKNLRDNNSAEKGCGFLYIVNSPAEAIDNNNNVYSIPMQFNPEVTGESRSANWSQQTAIGRTNEHFIWSNTGSRTIQFKTTYAVISPGRNAKDWFKDNGNINDIYSGNEWAGYWTEENISGILNLYRGLLLPKGFGGDSVDVNRMDGNRLSPPVITIWFGSDSDTRFSDTAGGNITKATWIATDLNLDPRLEAGYTNERNPRMYDITMTLKEIAPSWRSYQTHAELGL
jgi:hypothetical protein